MQLASDVNVREELELRRLEEGESSEPLLELSSEKRALHLQSIEQDATASTAMDESGCPAHFSTSRKFLNEIAEKQSSMKGSGAFHHKNLHDKSPKFAGSSDSIYAKRTDVDSFSGLPLSMRYLSEGKLHAVLEENRARVLKLKNVAAHAFSADGPWATLGVLARIEARATRQQEACTLWTLSDLSPWSPCTLQLWLYGDAHKQMSSPDAPCAVGELFLALGPKVVRTVRVADNSMGLVCAVTKTSQLIRVGRGAQLGRCPFKLFGGSCCGALIHRAQAEYCAGHMGKATTVPKSTRLDLVGFRVPPQRADGRPSHWSAAGAARRTHARGPDSRGSASHADPAPFEADGEPARATGDAKRAALGVKRAAQEEVRKEFVKRRMSVGARNLVQQVCHLQEKEQEEQKKARRLDRQATQHARATAPRRQAASSAPPRAQPPRPPPPRPLPPLSRPPLSRPLSRPSGSPAAADEEDVMLLDDDGELLPPTEIDDELPKGPRFTWQEVMPLPDVPTASASASLSVVSSIFGEACQAERGSFLDEVDNVANWNARVSAASMR